jgi:hypothetical protein
MEPEEIVHGTTPLALKRQWRVMEPEEIVQGTTPLALKRQWRVMEPEEIVHGTTFHWRLVSASEGWSHEPSPSNNFEGAWECSSPLEALLSPMQALPIPNASANIFKLFVVNITVLY